MSDMKVVELVGRRTHAGVGDDQKESVTEQALAEDFGGKPSLHATTEELDELLSEALCDAPAELSDEEICAVVALRHAVGIHTALEQLLLLVDRAIEARKNDKNGLLMDVNNTPIDEMPSDTGRAVAA